MRCVVGKLMVLSGMVLAGGVLRADSPEQLVRQLGSPLFAEREMAEARLLELGAAALPAVRHALQSSPEAEVRERAMQLYERLSRRADTERLMAAKPVRLEYHNTPLASAIADFKQKTNIPLLLLPGRVADANRPVTMPPGDYFPWEGLEVLLMAAGLREEHREELPIGDGLQDNPRRYSRYYGETAPALYTATNAPILLVDGAAERLPGVRRHNVRILALPPDFAANRVVRGAGRVTFHLDVAAPSTTGWNGGRAVRVDHAEDEAGRPVFADFKLQNDPAAVYEAFGGNFFARRVFWNGGVAWIDDGTSTAANTNPRLVPVHLRTNDRAIRKLSRFEGAVIGEIHTHNVPVVTVDRLDVPSTSQAGAQHTTLQVLELTRNSNGSHTLKIRYEAPTPWALNNVRGLGFGGIVSIYNDNPGEVLNRLRFYDADGIELKKPAQESTSFTGDGFRQVVEAALRFPKSAKTPSRMVLTGTRVSTVEVPFQMTNVPLP